MKGLELCRKYYIDIIEPQIKTKFPECYERMAAGLFGHGSQCLRFDDDISKDHDWGIRVCLLLNDEDYKRFSSNLEQIIKESPSNYAGYNSCWNWLVPRGGALKTSDWFTSLLDGKEIPSKPIDWLTIKEYELLWTTNGEIWHDDLGDVTKLREYLSYYPDVVWKKRLASKCAEISQSSGNIFRSAERNDSVSMGLAVSSFAKDAMHIWFLLNHTYAPFYKWLYRAFSNLPELPDTIRQDVLDLFEPNGKDEKISKVHKILTETRRAVNFTFPYTSSSEKLWEISYKINDSIEDEPIKNISVWDQVKY